MIDHNETIEELRITRDYLDNILNTMQDGILVTDAGGTIIQCNRAIEKILGYELHELTGHNTLDFIPEDESYRTIGSDFARTLFEKGFIETFETYFQKKNGDICPIECNITLLKNPDGSVNGSVSILRDITERKKMEQHLLQAEKLSSLGELAGGVAHDFNNVLAAILGRVQLLLSDIEGITEPHDAMARFEDIKKNMKIIETAAMDGAETVRRILEFARKKDAVGYVTPVDINTVIHDSIEFIRPRWKDNPQARGISFTIDKRLKPVSAVVGHAGELREVFINILNNAIDAMPSGGHICIESWEENETVSVSVRDTGIGIEIKAIEKIFDPFYTTKGPKSTGLGMSVSYGIIQRHKGTIEVESAAGCYTVFKISLPVYRRPQKAEEGSAPYGAQTTVTALVIEDEDEISRLLADILSSLGHQVFTAPDGERGLALLGSRHFDVVFTDLAMPGISGTQVAQRVKKCEPSMPVVLITGWNTSEIVAERDTSAVDVIINKPFTIQKIQEILQLLPGKCARSIHK